MRVTLIHNPTAGEDEQPSRDALLRLVRRAGHEVVYQSSKEDHWHRVLHEAGDIIVAAGGDGLVGKVAKRLVGRRTPIAVLPLGTANNVARTLGLMDMSLDQLIAGWRAAREMNIDIGIAHGPWGSTIFLESVGMGLFTETMSQLDDPRNHDLDHLHKTEEKLTSTLEILYKRLQSYAAKPLEVRLDGHDLTDTYVLLEAMNMRSIGPNLVLAPDADLGDGRLDIVLVPQRAQETLQRYLYACGEGRLDVPGLSVHRGRHLQIKWEGGMIHIDDDVWPDNDTHPAPCPTLIDVQVHAEPLRFLIPA